MSNRKIPKLIAENQKLKAELEKQEKAIADMKMCHRGSLSYFAHQLCVIRGMTEKLKIILRPNKKDLLLCEINTLLDIIDNECFALSAEMDFDKSTTKNDNDKVDYHHYLFVDDAPEYVFIKKSTEESEEEKWKS